jgi:hypothetical protein
MSENSLSRRDFVSTGVRAAVAGAVAGLTPTYTVAAGNPGKADTSKILNYNPDMEYRRCGRTGLMVSAVALGGHWKRIKQIIGGNEMGGWTGDIARPNFRKNRADVVSRCIERGINWVDACSTPEIQAYSHALRGRRDKMYIACSWYEEESRFPNFRTFAQLQKSIQKGLKEAGLQNCDLWRISLLTQSSRHTEAEIADCMKALVWAKKEGLARFVGVSSHDRPHLKETDRKIPRGHGDRRHALHGQDQSGGRRGRPLGGHAQARGGLVRHQAFRQQLDLQR